MSQLALYRKYRSADLDDVVGQDHITKTLAESLKRDKLSHAYLFTGPRGVGKTSVARILAKRVNGLKAEDDISSSLDIIEIDAASYGHVDDIRSLREKIGSSPTSLKYKVLIIDEVHMLSKSAFDALLKTLEEPPSHAIFILATTESHKLPDTIISRTQRYDFRPFSVPVIVSRLSFISESEGIKVEQAGLEAIAELSDGGMRDAISILDQLSVLNDVITAESVQSRMGLSSNSQIKKLLDLAATKDIPAVLNLLQEVVSDGVEPTAFCSQIQRFVRYALLNSDKTYGSKFLIHALELLQHAQFGFKNSPHRSLPLEIAMVKLCSPKDSPNVAKSEADSRVVIEKENVKRPDKKEDNKIVDQGGNENTDIDLTTQCAKGLSLIKESNNSLYALLRSGNARIADKRLIVDCKFNFHKERIEEFRNKEMIEKIMTKTCGTNITLKCNLLNVRGTEVVTEKDDELISSAMAILGGELIDG